MSDAEPTALDLLAHLRRELGSTITHILGYTEMLQELAGDFGQETFLPDLQKIHVAGKQLIELVYELIDTSATRLEDVDFPRLRFEIRTSLNHTVGYIEMLQERAHEVDRPEFLPDLDKVHAACRHLLTLANAGVSPETAAPRMPTDVRSAPEPGSGDDAAATVDTILVVDDNLQSRDHLGRLLRSQGYRVVNAGSGLSAMERLRAEKFDLVLLDVVMPGMNGYEVLQWLKADPNLREIPVIMLAAMNDTDNVVRCLVTGADDYLSKPFEPNLLKVRIHSCLERIRWKKLEEGHLIRIHEEQLRYRDLLRSILPSFVADRYRPSASPIVGFFPEVSVIVASLLAPPGAPSTDDAPPIEYIATLSGFFGHFDEVAEEHHVTRIKTFGATYLAATGLSPATPPPVDGIPHGVDQARRAAEFALAMQREVASFSAPGAQPIHLRVAIHTGPVAAAVVGQEKFSYDLFGDAVRGARELEMKIGRDEIVVSAGTYAALRDRYRFEERRWESATGQTDGSGYILLPAG